MRASRAPQILAGLAAGLLGLLPVAARAEVELEGAVEGSAGVTDNVLSAPDEPAEGQSEREGDVLTALSPRLRLILARPRASLQLDYAARGSFYARHTEAGSWAHRLGFRSEHTLGPTTQLYASLSGGQGRTNAINPEPGGAGLSVPAPNGRERFLDSSGRLQLVTTPSEIWRREANVTYAARTSLEDAPASPTTWTEGLSLSADRLWPRQSLGLVGAVGFASAWPRPAHGGPDDPSHRALGRLDVRGRRDLGPLLSAEVRGGAGAVAGLAGPPEGAEAYYLAAGATLRILDRGGELELDLGRDARVDPFSGTAYVADEARILGQVPSRWLPPNVTLDGGLSGGRLTPVAGGAGEGASIWLLGADVALAWRPEGHLALAVQYLHQWQRPVRGAEDEAGSPLGVAFRRQTVLVTATLSYPARRSALAPRPQASTRVDGADATSAR